MKEGAVRHFNIDGTCRTYFAVEDWSVDVADRGLEDTGIGSEAGEDMMGDERKIALTGRPPIVARHAGNPWAADC